jgi:DNA-binding NtrC family response regulator
VRILVASNEDLLNAVINGTFREDLYYRLNEYVIHIQPLRERSEDILFLTYRFMREVCVELCIELLEFSASFIPRFTLFAFRDFIKQEK